MSDPQETGTERFWDHEDCPRDDCEGDLQQQDRFNVECLSCGSVFTHCRRSDRHWLQDLSGEKVAEKTLVTDGGYPYADKDLSGGPDGSARTPCCFEEVETETTHADSGRSSGAIWRCPECGEEWQHPTETIGGPWGDSA